MIRNARLLAAVSLLAVATSCSKDSSDKPSPAASASAAPLAAASASPASSTAKGATPEITAWSGSYLAKVGPVAPPDNAKEKAWTDDPGTAAVGPGAIALSITGSRGDTRGELTGPLGDLKIAGVFDGTELRANLVPKDPKADAAMTGFMLLATSGAPPAALKGTLRVSNRDARIVREASVEIAKK
ncbi:MAG TPA: hypothetical protein VK540_24750 [Polyangiaceae bacterium]|nr:hypothetical protein [Polyangiaceae bacterium]